MTRVLIRLALRATPRNTVSMSGSGRDVDRVPLSDQDVAYLVGRSGQTRIRLENFSGARLNIDLNCCTPRAVHKHDPRQQILLTLARARILVSSIYCVFLIPRI